MSAEFYGEAANPSAIVIRANSTVEGIQFISPANYSQQIGLMTRPAGYKVPAHRHNLVDRPYALPSAPNVFPGFGA